MRRWLLGLVVGVLVLLGGAIVWGYAAAPGFVKGAAQDWVATNLKDKRLAIGKVAIDPLQLKADLADIVLTDTRDASRPLVRVKTLAVDANVASLWAMAPRLDSVTISQPFVDAVLRRDGSLNLMELVPPDDGTPVPDVTIGQLAVTGAQIDFTDQRRKAPTTRSVRPADFMLRDFATRANAGGGFRFAGTTDAGEGLAWDGTLGMAPVMSKGRFRLSGIRLAGLAALAGDALPVTLTGGLIDVSGSYDAALPPADTDAKVPPPRLMVDISGLTARDVALTAPTGDAVTLASATLAPTRLSLADDEVALGELKLSGLGIRRPSGERALVTAATLAASRHAITRGETALGALAVDGVSVTGRGKGAETVSLSRLTVAPSRIVLPTRRADIGAVSLAGLNGGARVDGSGNTVVPGLWPTKLPVAANGGGPAWSGSLAGLTMSDATLRVTVARPGQARTLTIAPANLTLGPVDSSLSAPVRFDADARLNGKTRLAARGGLTMAPAGTVDVSVVGLPLADLAALGPPIPIVIAGGTMDVAGKVQLGSRSPRFDGRMAIAGLDVNGRDGIDLVGWRRMDVTGIAATPQQLAIRRIVFDRAVSNVVVMPTRQINVMTAAGMESPLAVPDEAPAVAADAVAQASAPAPTPVAPPKRKVAAVISQSAGAIGAAIPTRVDIVEFRNSTIGFRDLSVEPNFSARIQGFAGTVSGLSTKPGTQAKFNLKGYVIDRFAPVSITGRANVFAYDADTDLTAKFTNIELPVFNPYSGRYAGYNIAKGKLTTTLHYRINNRALNADHNVRIDQLTWGEATDSRDKVPLPIRMATGLLKDKDGVIDLDLPVGGTLDDPKFRIWPLVWKVIGNVFTKIITAPFRFIGSLFGGDGEKAQFIAFAPASAALPPEAAERLKAIAKGLTDKAEVSLDIPAGAGVREDADAMAHKALETAVLVPKPGKPPLATDYASLKPDRKADRLRAVYKARFGTGPKPPAGTVPKAGLFASDEARTAATTAEIAWLEAQLLPKFMPGDAALAALGQARADAVKAALLADGAIPAERVFVATNLGFSAREGQVEMELKVK